MGQIAVCRRAWGPTGSNGSGDVDALAVAKAAANGFELHHTSGEGEQGVVLSFADIDARKDRRSALADQDRASAHGLTAIGLHTQALGIGIASVTC